MNDKADAMLTVGAFEAKTRFSELMELAHGGRNILVTKRGEPMVMIVASRGPEANRAAVLAAFAEIRAGARPGPSAKELIAEGRK